MKVFELDWTGDELTIPTFSSPTSFDLVGEFHGIFGHPVFTKDDKRKISAALVRLRLKLIAEEFQELCDATTKDSLIHYKLKSVFGILDSVINELNDDNIDIDLVEVADALGDITYVVNGAAHSFNIPLDEVVDEIHRSNMTKLDPATGKPIIREDGKILKPASYERPNIKSVLGLQ